MGFTLQLGDSTDNTHLKDNTFKPFKPFTISLQIDTVEQALCLWNRMNSNSLWRTSSGTYSGDSIPTTQAEEYMINRVPQGMSKTEFFNMLWQEHGLWSKVNAEFLRHNFNASTYEAKPPIKVGEYEVQFAKDSIKVGCTTVTKAQLQEILARME